VPSAMADGLTGGRSVIRRQQSVLLVWMSTRVSAMSSDRDEDSTGMVFDGAVVSADGPDPGNSCVACLDLQ